MQINEIFSSIEGEGIRTGYLVTFIRTQFCSCCCSYCDTVYSLNAYDDKGNKQYKDMCIDDIITKCNEFGNKRITFTGGEPLIQKDAKELVSKLTQLGYEVNIETNGNVDIGPYRTFDSNFPIIQDSLIITMDWKSPSSGMRGKMLQGNLSLLKDCDVLKFVVGSLEDLEDMTNILENNSFGCSIFVSPVFGKIELKDIVQYMKDYNMQNVRFQLQLHKYIWDPEMRGV